MKIEKYLHGFQIQDICNEIEDLIFERINEELERNGYTHAPDSELVNDILRKMYFLD
jgi:ferredoxin-thioredoxin reductase catalytic subunit